MKVRLRQKLIITILVAGVLSVSIGLIITAWLGTNALRKTLGANFEGLANETAHKVDLAMIREVADLQHISGSDRVIGAIKARNAAYEGLSERQVLDKIQRDEEAWRRGEPWNEAAALSAAASAFLDASMKIEKKEKIQYATFVTDRRGILVASTHVDDIQKLTPFAHQKEKWWQEATRMGQGDVFLGNIFHDEASNQFLFGLAIPIFDSPSSDTPVKGSSTRAIGALEIIFDVKAFLTPLIDKTRFGDTGHAMLIDSEGVVLACPILPTGMHIPEGPLITAVTAMNSGWIIAEDDAHGGKDSIVGFSPVEGMTSKAFDGNRWHSFIRQAPEETYTPISALLRAILFSGGLSIGFLVIIGMVVAKRLVEPIHLLQSGAEAIGKGDLDYRLNIRTGDEIEALADDFNRMAERLDESYTTLEEKVKDRTMELRDTVERLQEMDRLKSEFLSNVSHELRTPLTSIIGFSEILIDQVSGDLNPTQMGYVRNMFNSGHNLLEIISNLLDLSKIRSGRMQIHLRPCRLNEILDSVSATIAPLIEKKHLRLERAVEEVLPDISADEGKVRQILLNLLSNAVKFTGEGGGIKIGGKRVSYEGQSFVEIYVKDTGVGIRQNDLEMIFDEFRQVDASYTRDNPGTGLGLPITKHFVEMHGGRIAVKSALGAGSTFSFSLPVDLSAVERIKTEGLGAERPPQRQVRPGLEEKREEKSATLEPRARTRPFPSEETKNQPMILVVEDDRQASELIGLHLIRAGYQVVYAYDGNEAVEKAKEIIPFAITLDIMLPGKDGWQVLEALQGDPNTRDIPVIILSMVEDQENGFSLGAVDYLMKPLDKDALLKSLSKLDLLRKAVDKPVTILLVEHDPEIGEMIKEILSDTAFGVISASEIEEGITLALEGRPDIILLGLTGFPGQNGMDLPSRLMDHRIIKDIPVIVYIREDLTPELKLKLEGEIRKIIQFDGGSIKDDLLAEIKKYEKLYPDKARMIDGLTGLYNERYLRSRLSDEVDRAFRYKRAFSLVAANVDHFRGFNERNGLEDGDKALKDIGEAFRQNLRLADPISRFGGATFMVLMTETIQRPGILVAEKLRRIVESLPFPRQDGQGEERLTISVGVATFMKDAKTVEGMIRKVFDALERAKQLGGNQVVCANPVDEAGDA